MSESFSFTGSWSDQTKAAINEWIRNKLIEMQGEPPEDLFLEYIIIMIGNGKTMAEISHELNDFFCEGESVQFTDSLAAELKKYASVPKPTNVSTTAGGGNNTTTVRRSTGGAVTSSSATTTQHSTAATENLSSSLSSNRSSTIGGGGATSTTCRINSVAQKVADSEPTPSSSINDYQERKIRQQHQPLQSAKMNRLLQTAMGNTGNNNNNAAAVGTFRKRKIVDESTSAEVQDVKRSSISCSGNNMRIIRTVKPNIHDTALTVHTSTSGSSGVSDTATGFDPQAYMKQMNDMTKIIAQQQQMLNAMTLQQQQQAQMQQKVSPYGMLPLPPPQQQEQPFFHIQQQQYYTPQQQPQPYYHTSPPQQPLITGTGTSTTGYLGKKPPSLPHHKPANISAAVAGVTNDTVVAGTTDKFSSIVQNEPLPKSKKFSKPIDTVTTATAPTVAGTTDNASSNATAAALVLPSSSVPYSAVATTGGGRGYQQSQQQSYFSAVGGRGRGRGGRGANAITGTYHPNQTFIAGMGVGGAVQSPFFSAATGGTTAASAALTSSSSSGFFYQQPPLSLSTAPTLATAPVTVGGRFGSSSTFSGGRGGRMSNSNTTVAAAGRGVANKKWVRDVSESIVASAAAGSSNAVTGNDSSNSVVPIASSSSSSSSSSTTS